MCMLWGMSPLLDWEREGRGNGWEVVGVCELGRESGRGCDVGLGKGIGEGGATSDSGRESGRGVRRRTPKNPTREAKGAGGGNEQVGGEVSERGGN